MDYEPHPASSFAPGLQRPLLSSESSEIQTSKEEDPQLRPPAEDETNRSPNTVCLDFIDPRNTGGYVWNNVIVSGARAVRVLYSVKDIRPADVLSGLIVGIIVFVFCAVFSTVIFGDSGLESFVASGVQAQLMSAMVAGYAHVFFSDLGVALAAPDVFPTVFLGNMAITVVDTVISDWTLRGRNVSLVNNQVPDILVNEAVSTVLVVCCSRPRIDPARSRTQTWGRWCASRRAGWACCCTSRGCSA
jgi:hypothetical protein